MLARLLTAATPARTADAGGVVVLLLASVRHTGDPAQGALVLAVVLVPHVLAAPFVGFVTDRARGPRLVHAGFAALFGVTLGAVLPGSGPGSPRSCGAGRCWRWPRPPLSPRTAPG